MIKTSPLALPCSLGPRTRSSRSRRPCRGAAARRQVPSCAAPRRRGRAEAHTRRAGARALGERRGSSACAREGERERERGGQHRLERAGRARARTHQVTHGLLSENSTPSRRALRDRDWLTLAAHSYLTTCWTTPARRSGAGSASAPRGSTGRTSQQRGRTEEEGDLAPRLDAPLAHVRLELERDDEHGPVDVRVGRRERVVRRVGVQDVRADLDGAVDEDWVSFDRLRARERERGSRRTGTSS